MHNIFSLNVGTFIFLGIYSTAFNRFSNGIFNPSKKLKVIAYRFLKCFEEVYEGKNKAQINAQVQNTDLSYG